LEKDMRSLKTYKMKIPFKYNRIIYRAKSELYKAFIMSRYSHIKKLIL